MPNSERLLSASKLVIMLGKKFRNRTVLHYDDLMAAIADVPTVDAVEVVRCKDCIYNEKSSCMFSQFVNPHYRPDYFCADGERKDNG